LAPAQHAILAHALDHAEGLYRWLAFFKNSRQEKRPGDVPGLGDWWSWRELNPRPQAFFAQFYMFSRLL
jgi:hypothetical protein